MKITDDMLSAQAAEARELWLQACTPDALPEHRFSRKFRREMRRLVRAQKHSAAFNRSLRLARRTAAVLLLSAAVSFGCAMSVEAYRVSLINTVVRVFNDLTDYRFSSALPSETDSKAFTPPVLSGLPDTMHKKMIDLFKKYILVGGLPKAVDTFVKSRNVVEFRSVQNEVHTLYGIDASKYEEEHSRKLKIRRIFDMIPSNLENKKKRVVIKDIENKTWKRTNDYLDEFDYLISSGIALEVKAISKPSYPLVENSGKNLLKLYLNDVGILSGIFYRNNITAVMSDMRSINLGSVYETVVAQELKAHGYELYYYDNKKNGEVDYLIDDADNLSNIPIEVKSGKDYTIHSALDKFLSNDEYNIKRAYVLSNEQNVYMENGVTYIPVYYVMFFENVSNVVGQFLD